MRKNTLMSLLAIIFFGSLLAQDPVTYESAFPSLSFEYPVELQNAGDGTNRMFVVEQPGRIKVFQNASNVTQQQTFLDIRNIVSFSAGQEIGLLGLAFHPNYQQNGYFYVYHTRTSSVANVSVEIVLARYQVNSGNPNQANASSRVEIFSFDKNQGNSNHNGGKIAFGPDGYLYISVGDGGGGGDPNKNAQNLNNVFGSILRIDVDVDGNNPLETNPDAPNGNYEIPSDNPRLGQSGLDELYAWGIRNTWKFSFDDQTNRLWGADVGQNRYEEINLIQKGGNYGWNRFEATTNQNTSTNLATTPDIKPVFYYGRNNGDISITGGYVYRGSSSNTNIKDKYIYADYVSGRVWALTYNASNNTATSSLLFRTSGEYVSSFGLDESGEMYFSGYGTSAKIFKINAGSTPPPPPGPTTVAVDGVGLWKDLENGTNGTVEAVASKGDNVYVAGSFSNAGGVAANNIAVYNRTTGWKSLSSGANGTVKALAIAADGKVYAGGSFSSIGGIAAQNVAVWNGSSWSALGAGANGTVAKIGIDGANNVYVGGAFETAGGISVKNIARWNNGWSALVDSGTGERGTNNEIRAIAFGSNNLVYLGGNFDSAGGKTANRIATWNGSSWGTLGQGTSGFVQAIEVVSGYVYAGGNFSLAGGQTVNRIARWNLGSSQWEAMGNGLSGNVNSMDHDGTYLYVGGSFETAGQDSSTNYIVKNMARWSGGAGWQALGPAKNVGANNIVNDIAFSDDDDRLYVGGTFSTAGNVSASRLGVWAQAFDCTDEQLIIEYQINGDWSSGQSALTVEVGTRVVLSLLPNNVQFSITLPDGSVVNNDYSLGEVEVGDSGAYVYRTQDGCETTLQLTVTDPGDPCTENGIFPEYRIDNGNWIQGDTQITVDEGTNLILSIYPNDQQFTVTLPNGGEVQNDVNLGAVSPDEAGLYLFTSAQGCTTTFTVVVIEDQEVCPDGSIVPEYTVNNVTNSGTGTITVNEGDDLVLGSTANDPGLTIRLPNGSEVGDNYQLNNIATSQAGTYVFISSEGCEATLDILVNDIEVPTCEIQTEYRLNGQAWIEGASSVTVDEGDDLILSIVPNGVAFTITAPNGTTSSGDLNLGDIQPTQEGVYTFTRFEGCSTTLNVIVNADQPANCTIIPEYRLNRVWYSGETNITVQEGTDVMLSILPNNIGLTITLPNGQVVSDNYSLGLVTAEDNGIYTFTTADGCITRLTITVETSQCGGILIPEYRINGEWSSGENSISINEGADVALSMLPNGVGLNITLPDGTVVGDNYRLPSFTAAQNGIYTLTSAEGCTETLELRLADNNGECSENVIPEYRIDGKWFSGEENVTVDQGTNVMLSMLPNSIAMTITKPDGTVVGDNYNLGSVQPEDSGLYILRSADGCTNTLNLNVRNLPNCSAGSIISEYRVNGQWQSGQDYLQLTEGTDFIISALPNTINVSIELPDGREVGDNYYLGALTQEDSGFYILTSSQGCKTVLELSVVQNGGQRNSGFDEFGVDFENPERATELVTAYPNPTTDKVNIDLYSLKGQKVDVVLTNTQQQQLVFKSLKEDHPVDLELSLGNYNAGTYFVMLLVDGEVITKKVVKR